MGAHAAVTRAHESDDKSEASESSGEESEDQEATGAHAETNGRRSQWTVQQDPVKQLRQQERQALETKNDNILGAIYDVDLPMVARIKARQSPSTWVYIFTDDPTEQGVSKFAELPQVSAVLTQLQSIDQGVFVETRFTRHIHFISLMFSSKHKAKLARRRTHRGTSERGVAALCCHLRVGQIRT